MEQVTEKARAKLNLTMEVLDRRPDGYHNIRSVMVFLDLWDRVTVEKAPAFSFWCSDPALDGPENLAVRAWEALRARYPAGPVSIRLTKRTPCQSGMGGGSADAAAVLRGLNRLFQLGLSREELCRVGRSLGADVPACVLEGGLLLHPPDVRPAGPGPRGPSPWGPPGYGGGGRRRGRPGSGSPPDEPL